MCHYYGSGLRTILPVNRGALIVPSYERCPMEQSEYDYHWDQELLMKSMSEKPSWVAKMVQWIVAVLKCIHIKA